MKRFGYLGTHQAILVAAAMITIGSSAAACGGLTHPATSTLSTEGKLAVYGRQVVAATSGAVDGVDNLITAAVLPRAEGVQVLQRLRLVGTESQRLADALSIMDQARTLAERQTALVKIGEVVKALQKAVSQSVIPVNGERARTEVIAVLQNLSDLIVTISLAVPKPTGPVALLEGLPVYSAVAITPAQILSLILILFNQYRKSRQDIIEAGDPTGENGELLDDEQLIQLLKLEGKELTDKIDALIAKHGGVPDSQ